MQRRRLIRVAGLDAFRRHLAGAAIAGSPTEIRQRTMILPSRAAVELLRRAIEDGMIGDAEGAVILPSMLTRDEWLADIHAALPGAPRLLSRVEREVLIERAAAAVAADTPPPFELRPGLTAAMLDFYDELRRRGRTVERFHEAVRQELDGAEYLDDVGSARIALQTDFLAALFAEYERSAVASGALDEHAVRALALASPAAWPVSHVVVAVADHPSDPRGLWPMDFDLLGRLSGLAAIDVIVTDQAHDAGFRERIDHELPDLEDVRLRAPDPAPALLVPAGLPAHAVVAECRDREEEVRFVARAIRARATAERATPLGRTAIVFQRPLPYLYLAQQVLADAGVPYQTFDNLPLSAEPFAALLDQALIVARSGGTRASVLELMRSPLLSLADADGAVTIDDLAALDRVLIESRIGEGPLEWPDAVARAVAAREREFGRIGRAASRAAGVAAAVSASLAPFRDADRASAKVGAIAATIRRFETPPMRDAQAGGGERHLRARGAVLSTLDALARAYAAHDDHPRPADQVAAAILHWIARQTFTPRRGTTGVHLVDAVAARFGAFDHVHLVGLVDAEWPERQRRSVFYTTAFLGKLGWPTDDAHLRSEQAAFRDLVRLPSATLSLTAFQLEGEAVVAATPLTDEARALERREIEVPASRLFADERLAWAPPAVDGLPSGTAAWLALRTERPDQAGPEYRGQVGTLPPREYRVSQLDQFALCAFKYFAGAVLRLDEEPDADAALTPRERGNLLHGIFETFYREWQEAGYGAITSANMAQAIDRFEAIVQDRLASLPEADRIIESSRLLGSIVMRGVAERVFSEEVKDGRAVERRELEVALHGTYAFPPQGFAPAPSIAIRGVADRIDRMADGTLRLVDYKLTRAPSDSAVQLKVYAHAAGQKFGSVETPAVVSRAEYISFGDDREAVRSIVARNSTMEQSVLAGAQKFAEYVGAVEGGRFAPAPEKASLCAWCAYALVCRKEVVERDGDDGADDGEADAAESV